MNSISQRAAVGEADGVIAVVLPAYNEASRIRDAIVSVPSSISVEDAEYATLVVVVDDSSSDQTRCEASAVAPVVLHHLVNCGAGAATRTGLRYALDCVPGLKYIVTMDADGQHLGSDVERIVQFAAAENAEMVVGNRLHPDTKGEMPPRRAIGNKGLNLISRILFGIRVADTQSGLRLMTPAAAAAVIDYSIDGYGFCTEMLWLARRKRIDIREMPIGVRYSAETLAKGQSSWGVIDLLLDLVWIRITR